MCKYIGFGLIGLALVCLLPLVFLIGLSALFGLLSYIVYEAFKYEKEIDDELNQDNK